MTSNYLYCYYGANKTVCFLNSFSVQLVHYAIQLNFDKNADEVIILNTNINTTHLF